MNKILIGLPISDLQLLLAVSRRIDELSALDRLIQPEEFRLVRDLLVDIMEGYEHGLSTLYEAARERTAPSLSGPGLKVSLLRTLSPVGSTVLIS